VTTGLPSTTQLTSLGGLLGSVSQIIVTLSPDLASLGPLILTLAGPTEQEEKEEEVKKKRKE
jgi:hypothetical protein